MRAAAKRIGRQRRKPPHGACFDADRGHLRRMRFWPALPLLLIATAAIADWRAASWGAGP
ncbi:MAG: hypothetical protein ACJA1L_002507, partial [Paracoccaceae bacterium]